MKRSFLYLFFLLVAFNVAGADLQRGQDFSDGQRIYASQLQALVDSATILPGFYSDKTVQSTFTNATDVLLLYSPSLSGYRKITAGNLLLNNTYLITGQTEDTAPALNDFMLTYDASGTVFKKVAIGTIFTNYALTYITNYVTNAAIIGVSRDLVVSNTSTAIISATATEFMLKNTAGVPWLASSPSVTANIATSGTNGLDTGSEAASTWYYIYIISDGTNLVRGLLSASATSPTLPSGYTYQGLAGAVFNDSSSNFVDFVQTGKFVTTPQTQFITNTAVHSANVLTNASSGQLTTFRTLVPPIARGVAGLMGCTNATLNWCRVSASGASDSTKTDGSWLVTFPTTTATMVFASWRVPMWVNGASRTFGYSSDSTTPKFSFWITGYELP